MSCSEHTGSEVEPVQPDTDGDKLLVDREGSCLNNDGGSLLVKPDTDGGSLLVSTTGTCCSSVDVLHAYCAVALLRHRLANLDIDSQCSMKCCSQELTVYQLAGLCRLLLWDEDVCRRRCDEELLYIETRLCTSLSGDQYMPSSTSLDELQTSNDQESQNSSITTQHSDAQSNVGHVNGELSSRGILFSFLICLSFGEILHEYVSRQQLESY